MKRFLTSIAIAVSVCGTSLAQDGTFVATVSPRQVAAGEQFEVVFTMSGRGGENFSAPDFGQFVVISGPSTLDSYQFIDGRSSSSRSKGRWKACGFWNRRYYGSSDSL